jgi:hypothetical protein
MRVVQTAGAPVVQSLVDSLAVATVELSGLSIVGAGSFNPAIFHPRWFQDKGLLSEELVELLKEDDPEGNGTQVVVTNRITAFTADWVSVRVTDGNLILTTVEEARERDLRDLAAGIFDLLPETPVDAIGVNADAHYRTPNEASWHAVGDRFLPKDFWEPIFEGDAWRRRDTGEAVGLRTMTVEGSWADESGYVRVEVAPSQRLEHGVFVGMNAHYQLTREGDRGTGFGASQVLGERWDEARGVEQSVIERLLEAV